MTIPWTDPDAVMKIGDKERIKQLALEDPDLQPLWDEIRKL